MCSFLMRSKPVGHLPLVIYNNGLIAIFVLTAPAGMAVGPGIPRHDSAAVGAHSLFSDRGYVFGAGGVGYLV